MKRDFLFWVVSYSIFYPFVILFRVAMVTMCFEIRVRFERETLKLKFNHNNSVNLQDNLSELSGGADAFNIAFIPHALHGGICHLNEVCHLH